MDGENTHMYDKRSVVVEPDVLTCQQLYSGDFCSFLQHFGGLKEIFWVQNSKK